MVGSMRKIELLRALGRLSLIDYYTIPKYKRTFILQQGLAAMVTLPFSNIGVPDDIYNLYQSNAHLFRRKMVVLLSTKKIWP